MCIAAAKYFGQALPIRREVDDRAGEAVTCYNVAMIHRAQGELGRAVAEVEQVVELDRQVGHPDLQSDTEMLRRVRQELAGSDAAQVNEEFDAARASYQARRDAGTVRYVSHEEAAAAWACRPGELSGQLGDSSPGPDRGLPPRRPIGVAAL